VLGAAALLILVPWLFFNQAFYPTFYRAMTWLVVASPCALVISTPASILSAIANGARHGVLFKGGVHLEKTATLKVLAFDKTGTLTLGTPTLTSIHSFDKNMEENQLLTLAAALEARSEHPLAKAIVQAAHDRSLDLPPSIDFRAIPGQGVEGHIDERTLWMGNERMFHERGIEIHAEIKNKALELEKDGQTAMYIYCAGSNENVSRWLGLVAVADTLREDAIEMIAALKQAGIERVVMLTGDNPHVANPCKRNMAPWRWWAMA
jgi:Cd2+/Zn2+-exporting ATPase